MASKVPTADAASGQPRRKPGHRLVWAAVAVFGAAALAFGFFLLHQEKPLPVRVTVDTPNHGALPLFGRPSVSPDGKSILFAVTDPATPTPVWYLHILATRTSSALPEAGATTAAYWSFDSRSILLSRSNVFWRMDLNTRLPQRSPVVGAYTSWQPEGIVTGGRSGLRWFRPDGSGLRWLKKPGEQDDVNYSYPSLIPGGRWLLYNTSHSNGAAAGFSLHLASLDGKVDRQILTSEHAAIYAGPGYLLFLRGNMLMAQAIDPASGKLRGDPAPIAGPIATTTAGITDQLGSFSASDNGVLVFRIGPVPPEQAPSRIMVIVNWPSLLRNR